MSGTESWTQRRSPIPVLTGLGVGRDKRASTNQTANFKADGVRNKREKLSGRQNTVRAKTDAKTNSSRSIIKLMRAQLAVRIQSRKDHGFDMFFGERAEFRKQWTDVGNRRSVK